MEAFHHSRIIRVQNLLNDLQLDAVLIENPIDLYYLTGLSLSLGSLTVDANEAQLYVDGRYYAACKEQCSIKVKPSENETCIQDLKAYKSIGIDSRYTSVERFEELQSKELSIKPIPAPLSPIRIIKDSQELDILREAASIGSQGMQFIMDKLKHGISEHELAQHLQIFWLECGGQGVAFDPIIAFGANSALPHHRAGLTRLESNSVVLLDIGVKWKHYHSDMTRTISFGRMPEKIEEIYPIVKKAQNAALALCKEGVTAGELDEAARSVIRDAGYGDYYPHSLGHGVGLNIHEAPMLRNKPGIGDLVIKEGMVITIEPGIYLPGIGGVRIENTIHIEKNGFEDLTQFPVD